MTNSNMSPRKTFALGLATILVLVIGFSSFQTFEQVDAEGILIVQSPLKGIMTWYSNPGIKWQGFGKVTEYRKRDQFWFSTMPDQGLPDDQSIRVRFNDNGHAWISGSLSWEMPLDNAHLTALHTKYGSHEAIEHELIRTVIEKAIYMTGPLMSSKESAAERRNELLRLIEDQIENGVYETETIQERQPDPMTGVMKTVSVVRLVKDEGGKPVRVVISPLQNLGIKTYNLSINGVKYDDEIEKQIQQQQQALMQIQLAMAKAKEAEQEAITAVEKGKANAALQKWEQEAIKAKEVTRAEQEKQVAEIDAQKKLEVAKFEALAAEQTKLRDIRLGEGEATRKHLVMEADGALEPKLRALIEINHAYAEAIKGYSGHWVPTVVMGNGGNTQPGSGAQTMIDLLTAQTARQLGVDLGVAGIGKTKTE